MPTIQQIDVAEVASVVRRQGKIRQPIDVTVQGRVVGRMVPPGELSEAEKEEVVRQGWEVIQEARARNQGVSEREIGNVIDAAVKRVRARK